MVYTGQSVKRFEDPRLLTGQGTFLDDIKLPGMLHAAVLRSPHAHAHITSIDTAAARHVPGVVAVFTAEDLEGVVEPVPTRRETEARNCDLPSTRSWRAARYATSGNPSLLWWPRTWP